MTLTDLKYKLIDKINQTEDNYVLEELYRLLTINESDFNILELTPEQKAAIQIAQEQYKNGQFLTQEQADKDIEKCLDK